jgi:hypothetical protein
MRYLKHYIAIIRNAESRVIIEKHTTEKHHVFPVSVFGKNDRIVKLTFREHLVCHILLWKAFQKRYGKTSRKTYKMLKACLIMTGSPLHYTKPRHISSRLFDMVKRNAIQEFLIGDNNPAKRKDVRDKISAAKTGKPRNDMKGKRYFGASEETISNCIQKIITNKTGKKTNYPKNRKLKGKTGPNEKMSINRRKANEKYRTMNDIEFQNWLSLQNPFAKNGVRKNSNICRALKLRGLDIQQYYSSL